MWSNLLEPLAGSGNWAILWKLIIHQRLDKGKCQRIHSLETWEIPALDFNGSNVPMVGLFSDDKEVLLGRRIEERVLSLHPWTRTLERNSWRGDVKVVDSGRKQVYHGGGSFYFISFYFYQGWPCRSLRFGDTVTIFKFWHHLWAWFRWIGPLMVKKWSSIQITFSALRTFQITFSHPRVSFNLSFLIVCGYNHLKNKTKVLTCTQNISD